MLYIDVLKQSLIIGMFVYNFSQIFIFISGAQRVDYIWPRSGSINGGTHVTIVGKGECWTNFGTLQMRLKTNVVFLNTQVDILCNESEHIFKHIFIL